ncbi:MAG: hypothetical protein QOI56_372 [Actinomycetota bacterium]|nr:hypothetical protein [Actinomycetota bacterium]
MARAAGPATTSPYGAASATTELADGVDASDDVASSNGALGVSKLLDGLTVGEEVKGLLQRRQVLRADEHRSRRSVPGDHDAVVLTLDPIDEL